MKFGENEIKHEQLIDLLSRQGYFITSAADECSDPWMGRFRFRPHGPEGIKTLFYMKQYDYLTSIYKKITLLKIILNGIYTFQYGMNKGCAKKAPDIQVYFGISS